MHLFSPRNPGPNHHRAKYSAETVECARLLYDNGQTYKSIGQQLNVPWHTVRDWCAYRTRIYG